MASPEDRERYARICGYFIEGATGAMRKVFNGFHPPLFIATSLLQPDTITLLKRMRSFGILSEAQWRLLFPLNKGRPDSDAFDGLLLSILLKYACRIPAPYPGGWNASPATSDYSMAADIVRIQLLRKLIASQAEMEFTDDEYEVYRRHVQEVLERLEERQHGHEPLVEASEEFIKKLEDWELRAKESEKLEEKVESSIRKKTDDKHLATQETSDTLKDLIEKNTQPKRTRFTKGHANKVNSMHGMKPEELRQHETKVLHQFQKQIIEKIYADEVVPKLIQRGILSHEDKNRINLATRNSDRIKLILEMLPKKSANGSFDKFCDVIKYKHTALHDQLLKAKQAPFVREKPDECSVCASSLRNHYVNYLDHCQPLPWQPDTHVLRSDFLLPWFISDFYGKMYDIKTMFENNSRNERPRKILLEGSSGTGKSTLCASVALAWAKRQLSPKIHLAFFLDLKMASEGLMKSINEQCLLEDFNEDDTIKLIKKHERETLFILDGYENIPNIDSDIYDLVQKRLFPKSTVLLTAESAFINRAFSKQFDTNLLLSGLIDGSQVELIERYCNLMNKQSADFSTLLDAVVTDTTAQVLSLKPLFCLCMCLIALNGGNLSFDCLTDLLQEYLITLQKVFCKVNFLQMEDGALPDEMKILVATVEETAYESLVNHRVVFSAETLVNEFRSKMEPWFNVRDEDVFKVGLIQMHGQNEEACYFANRIFQEFLAAHSLVNHDSAFVTEQEDMLMTERHTVNILPLYCGIQRILQQEDALQTIAEWMHSHIRESQQAQPIVTDLVVFVLNRKLSKMENKLTELSLPLACLQESQMSTVLTEIVPSLPSRVFMKYGEAHHVNVVQGLSQILRADLSGLTELELRLDHLAHHQQPLYLQLASGVAQSKHITCLKLCWSNTDLMAEFLAAVFDENRVITQLALCDESATKKDYVTATLWAHLKRAGQNMTELITLAFTHCSNLALVTSFINHIPDTVRHVHLDYCSIDLAGAQNLNSLVEKSQALESLSLKQVKINRADFLKVSLGIRLNRSMKELDLSGIDLDHTSVGTLSEALKFNSTMRRLDLSHIPLTTEGCEQLGFALGINSSLREVSLHRCGLSEEALETLKRHKKKHLLLTGTKRNPNISVSDVYYSRSTTMPPEVTPRPVRKETSVV